MKTIITIMVSLALSLSATATPSQTYKTSLKELVSKLKTANPKSAEFFKRNSKTDFAMKIETLDEALMKVSIHGETFLLEKVNTGLYKINGKAFTFDQNNLELTMQRMIKAYQSSRYQATLLEKLLFPQAQALNVYWFTGLMAAMLGAAVADFFFTRTIEKNAKNAQQQQQQQPATFAVPATL